MMAKVVPHVASAPPTIRSIQLLRAAAATLVVLFHLGLAGKGYTGVDLFFVISGFIMGTVGDRDRPGAFLMRRILRIAPLYWAVTLALCALSLVPGLMRNFDFTAGELAKSLLFIPYMGRQGEIWPLVIPGWTLNFEIFFYALFAVGLAIGRPRATTILLLLVLVALGLAWPGSDARYRVYTSPLLLEFAAGLAIAHGGRRLPSWLGLPLFGAGVLLFAAMLFMPFGIAEGFERLLFAGLPAVLVVGGAVAMERAGQWRSLAPLEYVGDISYSLYLTHGLVLAFTARYIAPGPAEYAVGLIACYAGAAATYHLFEKPVTDRLQSGWRRLIARRENMQVATG